MEKAAENKRVTGPPSLHKSLPVLFFLFPGSCVFQNGLLCLGRCDVLGSSNYLGLSKVAVPKTKTNFHSVHLETLNGKNEKKCTNT